MTEETSPASYFELRNVSPDFYLDYSLPAWLASELSGVNRNVRILDFGCGYGKLIGALKRGGYENVEGADVESQAIAHGRNEGYKIHDLREGESLYETGRGQFDIVISQHVLEHLPKTEVIAIVSKIRSLLTPEGKLIVSVPNAQAFTGCYWAYEDFTHQTLYTSGSVYYVLKAAGFPGIQFIDIDSTSGLSLLRRVFRRVCWKAYDAYYKFMCRILANATHAPSPNIFSYEIKAVARNRG